MTESDWNTKYEQLNERARWYSSQLWYIPFAYVGLVGMGIDKIFSLTIPFKGIALIFLGIFSLSVYVHVSALKYYERRAVRSMQQMETKPASGGASPWYVNFTWYTKLMILVATYALIGHAVLNMGLALNFQWIVFGIAMVILTILFAVNAWEDRRRNKALFEAIRHDVEKTTTQREASKLSTPE